MTNKFIPGARVAIETSWGSVSYSHVVKVYKNGNFTLPQPAEQPVRQWRPSGDRAYRTGNRTWSGREVVRLLTLEVEQDYAEEAARKKHQRRANDLKDRLTRLGASAWTPEFATQVEAFLTSLEESK